MIALTVTDCPGSVSQSFIKLCPACGAVCTGAPGTFLCSSHTQHELRLPCWWEWLVGTGAHGQAGRERTGKSFSPGYVWLSMQTG